MGDGVVVSGLSYAKRGECQRQSEVVQDSKSGPGRMRVEKRLLHYIEKSVKLQGCI